MFRYFVSILGIDLVIYKITILTNDTVQYMCSNRRAFHLETVDTYAFVLFVVDREDKTNALPNLGMETLPSL